MIATELGAVRLHGRSLSQRVRLMIGLAAEAFRNDLERAAKEMGYL